MHRTEASGFVLVWIGAATASWDVVGVDILGRTLKLTTVCFIAAIALFALAGRLTARRPTIPAGHRVTLWLITALLAWLGLRSLVADDVTSSLGGFASQLIPAGAPFVAVLLCHHRAAVICRAFAYGMVATSAAAIYEVVAKTNDWYWPTSYTAFAGGTHRAAGFSFEAAYFAAAAVAAIPICLWFWNRRLGQAAMIAVLLGGIVAANARIVFVQVAVGFIVLSTLALWMRGPNRARLLRALAAVSVLALLGVAAVAVVSPSTAERVGERAMSIFDPDEATSNSPRLEQFAAVADVIADHPVVGIGPARLGDELLARGEIDDMTGDASFITNNIWTQSLIDGGAIALALQAAVVLSVI